MLCNRCHLWIGDPCGACRTESRIAWLLQSGQLRADQEQAVLRALRECCGVLLDLAEVATRTLRAPPPLPPPFTPRPPLGPPPFPPPGLVIPVKVEEGEKKDKGGKERKEKKTEKVKDRHRPKEEEKPRGAEKEKKKRPAEQTLPSGSAKDTKREVEEREKNKEEESYIEESEEEEILEEDPVGPVEEKEAVNPDSSAVDRKRFPPSAEVESNPAGFGLETLPSRGIEESRDSQRRPRSPIHPPRHHGSRREGETEERPRSREIIRRRARPKKNKGEKHKRRGRNWRHQRAQQEQWRRR